MPIITQPAELPKADAVKQKDTSGEAPAAVVAEAKSPEVLSPRFVALAKKEKALRSQMQAIKAREDALKAKEEEYQTSYVPKSSLSERFKSDPLSVMNEYGVSYDTLTQAILNQPPQGDPAISEIQKKLKAIEEAQTKSAEQFQNQQKQAYEQAVEQIRRDTKLLIETDAAFETIKETDSVEAVVKLIEETFKEEKVLLSVEEAAKEVEDYLVEESLKLARLKKVQAKLTPAQVEEQPKPTKTEKPSFTTLTHAQTASTKPLTNRDRRERAILAFQGKI